MHSGEGALSIIAALPTLAFARDVVPNSHLPAPGILLHHGERRYVDRIYERPIDLEDGGSVRMDPRHFKRRHGFGVISRKFGKL